jgi:arabinofuranosyltransferase
LWELFALGYYGFLVPNSAFAKLSVGVGGADLAQRGFYYLRNSLQMDPVTLTTILAGIVLSVVRGSARTAALGAGVLLYLSYVVCIGGDFMSGRFLTAPLVVACVTLVQAVPRRATWPLVAGLLILMLVPRYSSFVKPIYGPRWDAAIDAQGVADERAIFLSGSSLLTSRKLHPWPQPTTARDATDMQRDENWKRYPFLKTLHRGGVLQRDWPPAATVAPDGTPYRPLVVWGGVGCMGYYLGPGIHVLDYHGIGDPLLARLPAAIPDPVLCLIIPRLCPAGWRAGHFSRRIPDGYPETLATGVNRLAEPGLARYYDRLSLVTRGHLLDPARLQAIWDLNVGRCEPQLEHYRQQQRQANEEARLGGGVP